MIHDFVTRETPYLELLFDLLLLRKKLFMRAMGWEALNEALVAIKSIGIPY